LDAVQGTHSADFVDEMPTPATTKLAKRVLINSYVEVHVKIQTPKSTRPLHLFSNAPLRPRAIDEIRDVATESVAAHGNAERAGCSRVGCDPEEQRTNVALLLNRDD
jgi:hypothetical protein